MNYGMNNFWMKYMGDVSSSSSVFLENTLHQKLLQQCNFTLQTSSPAFRS